MILPRFSVRQIDRGWDALKRAAKEIKNGENYVKVGVLGDSREAPKKGTPVSAVDLALIHEYGAPARNIPARSFIRATYDAKRGDYFSLLSRMLGLIYDQKLTINEALELLGQRMAADVKARIKAGIPPPLAPATIARKGSSKQLIDTGQLLSSITYAVVDKNGERV